MNKEKEQEVKDKIIEIFDNINNKILEDGLDEEIDSITYYNELTLIENKNQNGLGEEDVYLAKIKGPKDKILYEIYKDNMLIAVTDNDGKIQFTEEYIENLKNLEKEEGVPNLSQIAIKNNGKQKFVEPEELKEEDRYYNKSDVALLKQEKGEIEKETEKGKVKTDEEQIENVAQKAGLKKEDIKASTKIDPKEQVTDKNNFEGILGISGRYTEIYAIYSNGVSSFYGINKKGEAEIIPELQQRATTSATREASLMNSTGKDIEKQTVRSIFDTKSPNESIALNVEQSGKLNVYYLLRNPENVNEYLGAPIATDRQTRATGEEKRFIGTDMENRSTKINAIEDADHELNETSRTNKTMIDENPYNDQITIDVNEKIEMPDGRKTTILEQASAFERKGISLGQYVEKLQKSKGKCVPDKILDVNTELEYNRNEEKNNEGKVEHSLPEDRGERIAPGEEI